MSSPFMQLNKPLNHSSLLCRGCLAESGEMKNMFEWGLAEDFYLFTDVQLIETDCMSGLICTKCEEVLSSCKSFRIQCQNSDKLLKNVIEVKYKPEETFIPSQLGTKSIERTIDCVELFLNNQRLLIKIEPPNNVWKLNLPCPFKCKKMYTEKHSLQNHLVKKHNVKKEFSIVIQYFCPVDRCLFNKDSESNSYFDDRKHFNQHYIDEHAYKEFYCIQCNTSFTTETLFVKHITECSMADSSQNNLQQESFECKEIITEQMDITENKVEFILLDDSVTYMITAPNAESKIYLPCPFKCKNGFIKKKDLVLHLVRKHNKKEKDFTIELKYFCSITGCAYERYTNCFFNGRKYLNQHYLKKHTEKTISCSDCDLNFATEVDYKRHVKTCNFTYKCDLCSLNYKSHDRWLVHLMRKHPELHKKYKNDKRKSQNVKTAKKLKSDDMLNEFTCDSPKRSFATQTLENIKNDVTLPSWVTNGTKKDEMSTQTVFEDMLSLKSQMSEDESIFFPETTSLSDIQTQTFPLEFGLSRCNKETLTSETQSPEFNIKETQTCVCLYESPKPNFRLFDSFSPSAASINLTSTETQTADIYDKSESIFGLNSTETQTCFDDELSKDDL